LQVDPEHATGSVSVTLKDGQPEYVIHQPVAWDFLEFAPDWQKFAKHADAVCFGTLAQRNEVSRETVHSFLAATSAACVRVFDVNLRKPFFNARTLGESLSRATLLKLNDAEMPVVLSLLDLAQISGTDADSLLSGARTLLDHYALELVCITMGPQGSLLVTPETHHRHFGIPTQVADTVGAGDAFTAALVHYYLQGAPLAVLNEAGNRWGSWVASQKGAMPALSGIAQEQIESQIHLVAAE
jgi:fructokinase